MKRLILGILFVFFVLAACSQKENNLNDTRTESNPPESISSGDDSSVSPSGKTAAEILNDLANQEFSIEDDRISNNDYETIMDFGQAFVNLFTGAVAEQEPVSFENYILNENLLRFANKMLELTQKRELKGGVLMSFGLKNKFSEAKFMELDETCCYINLPFEFEGAGMTCQLLIRVENGILKIADFYFGAKGGVDTFATGHSAVRKLDNPDLWDNPEWVDDVFEKLENYESELDS